MNHRSMQITCAEHAHCITELPTSVYNFKVFDLQLDAGFVEECVDVGREGDVELEAFFCQARALICHAKGDTFEHPVLFKIEFKVSFSDDFWRPDLVRFAVENGRGVFISKR